MQPTARSGYSAPGGVTIEVLLPRVEFEASNLSRQELHEKLFTNGEAIQHIVVDTNTTLVINSFWKQLFRAGVACEVNEEKLVLGKNRGFKQQDKKQSLQ